MNGSPQSNAALCWALRQAELTQSRLLALTSRDSPPIYGWERSA